MDRKPAIDDHAGEAAAAPGSDSTGSTAAQHAAASKHLAVVKGAGEVVVAGKHAAVGSSAQLEGLPAAGSSSGGAPSSPRDGTKGAAHAVQQAVWEVSEPAGPVLGELELRSVDFAYPSRLDVLIFNKVRGVPARPATLHLVPSRNW
jgi:hypothetical protein